MTMHLSVVYYSVNLRHDHFVRLFDTMTAFHKVCFHELKSENVFEYYQYIYVSIECFSPYFVSHLRYLYNNNISELAPGTFDGLHNLIEVFMI